MSAGTVTDAGVDRQRGVVIHPLRSNAGLDWLLVLIEQNPHLGSRIASLSYAGRGLVWIGRRKLGRKIFQKARDSAVAQPVITPEGPERFVYLLTTLQFAAESGLWDLAGEYFLETEQAGAELLKHNHPSFRPVDIRKGLDYFGDAVQNRRVSKPAPLLESKEPGSWR